MIPSDRTRYLGEISECVRNYKTWAHQQADEAEAAYGLWISLRECGDSDLPPGQLYSVDHLLNGGDPTILLLRQRYQARLQSLDSDCLNFIQSWPQTQQRYQAAESTYTVRGKELRRPNFTSSLSGTSIPKVSLPTYRGWGDQLRWQLLENVPGVFPIPRGFLNLNAKAKILHVCLLEKVAPSERIVAFIMSVKTNLRFVSPPPSIVSPSMEKILGDALMFMEKWVMPV